MLDATKVDEELVGYRMKLMALASRYEAGERSTIAAEAQDCGDALICLMEEAPVAKREAVDYLVDRYEALRISCSS